MPSGGTSYPSAEGTPGDCSPNTAAPPYSARWCSRSGTAATVRLGRRNGAAAAPLPIGFGQKFIEPRRPKTVGSICTDTFPSIVAMKNETTLCWGMWGNRAKKTFHRKDWILKVFAKSLNAMDGRFFSFQNLNPENLWLTGRFFSPVTRSIYSLIH